MNRLKRLGYSEYEKGLIVSTIKAADGDQPYETAVLDSHYSNSFVVVEAYDTEKEAIEGHSRWLTSMTTSPPDKLVEVMNGFHGSFKGLAELSYDRKTI